MKQLKQLLFTFSLLLIVQALPAQALLCFTPSSVSVDDDSVWTVTGPDSAVMYSGAVLNCGNAPVIGSINIYIKRNAGAAAILHTITNDTLGPGDSLSWNATDQVIKTGSQYKGGDNVIVIWPAVPSPPPNTQDTAQLDIWVESIASSRSEGQLKYGERFQFGPNPVDGELNIRYVGSTSNFDYVRIMDMTGKVIFHSATPARKIDFSAWRGGQYLMEFRYKDGKGASYKLLNE